MFSKKIIVEYLQKNKTSSFKNLARILNVASSQNKQFSTFLNVKLINSQISYYQLPYIIGIFKNLKMLLTNSVKCGSIIV